MMDVNTWRWRPFEMDFSVPQPICKIGCNLIPGGFKGQLSDIGSVKRFFSGEIDRLGELSAKAQGLKKVITTADKLSASEHILYLAISKPEDTYIIHGFLKVGHKKLYLSDLNNKTIQVEPLCVLDFYVEENKQRSGLGKKLFDFMLKDFNESPECIPIDGPSPKLIAFMKKHYNIDNLIRQANNFAVAPEFFNHWESAPTSERRDKSLMPPPVVPPPGRYSASRPNSAIALIIHGDPPSPPRQLNNNFRSNNVTYGTPLENPDVAETVDVETSTEFKERPSTLDVDQFFQTADGKVGQVQEEVKQAPLEDAVQTVATPKDKPDPNQNSALVTPAGYSVPRDDDQLTEQDLICYEILEEEDNETSELEDEILSPTPVLAA